MEEKALSGLTVVDLSTFLAVATCARFFADHGARVIKIESAAGDPCRWNGTSEGRTGDVYENTTWDLENAGKQGLCVNTKTEEGKKILFELLDRADVFLTNWRPQALKKNGLDYESLKARYPKLVYGSLTGYGETGPDCDLPGFDFTAYFARGGFSGDLLQKGHPPINLVPGLGDHQAGMMLASGIMAALLGAQRTGKGDKVTIDLLHTSVFVQAIPVMAAQYKGMGQEYPIDGRTADNPFNCAYRTKDDRWLQLSMPPFDQFYPRFMPIIGREDLAHDPRYTMENITKNHLNREFCDILFDAFEKKTAAEWAQLFTENDIPFSLMQTWDEVLEDRQAWANGTFESFRYPNGSVRTLVRQPVQLASEGWPEYRQGPLVGEHSEEIIRSLGYSDEELQKLHEQGVYCTWEDIAKKRGIEC